MEEKPEKTMKFINIKTFIESIDHILTNIQENIFPDRWNIKSYSSDIEFSEPLTSHPQEVYILKIKFR